MIPHVQLQLVGRRARTVATVITSALVGAGLALAAVALLGCVEPNPDYCERDEDCAGAEVCDLEGAAGVRNRCVPAPDAGVEVPDAR